LCPGVVAFAMLAEITLKAFASPRIAVMLD